MLKKAKSDNLLKRKSLVNIFVNTIYLWDDRFQLILNGSGKPIEITDIPIEDIDDFFEDEIKAHNECSHLVADAPPYENTIDF